MNRNDIIVRICQLYNQGTDYTDVEGVEGFENIHIEDGKGPDGKPVDIIVPHGDGVQLSRISGNEYIHNDGRTKRNADGIPLVDFPVEMGKSRKDKNVVTKWELDVPVYPPENFKIRL